MGAPMGAGRVRVRVPASAISQPINPPGHGSGTPWYVIHDPHHLLLVQCSWVLGESPGFWVVGESLLLFNARY